MSERGLAERRQHRAAARSRELVVAGVTLALLPPMLPFPSTFLALKWIVPALSPCPTNCPPSTYGERLE